MNGVIICANGHHRPQLPSRRSGFRIFFQSLTMGFQKLKSLAILYVMRQDKRFANGLCAILKPCIGGVSERLKEAVLKTVVPKGTVGSNPTASARIPSPVASWPRGFLLPPGVGAPEWGKRNRDPRTERGVRHGPTRKDGRHHRKARRGAGIGRPKRPRAIGSPLFSE